MGSEPKGRGGKVRPGEELDVAAVTSWLRPLLPTLTGSPEVTQYAGGASNWTYRLRFDTHDLVLRRPPAGTKAKSSHDMGREFRVQSALRPLFPYVPNLVALCEDPSVLGVPFYVMEHVDGVIPRASFPRGVHLDEASAQRLCKSFVDRLVQLHRVDVAQAGLTDLGKGPGYARRQVEGWSERYQRARTWNVPRFSGVIRWLKERIPDDVRACVIHNDFRLDNVVLSPRDPTQIVCILDWELATVGDPLMDLGSSLAYWVEAGDGFFARRIRRQPSHLPGMFTRRELVDYYLRESGLTAPDLTFYEVYGLFRLAGIIQQIYFRYHRGETKNPAFKNFWLLVHYFHWRSRQLMRSR
jgi:aminoglycoside phosphotransferase (APT) family kinase protein